MQEKITFESDGVRIAGAIHLPTDYRPGQRRPAVIMMHGFGSNMEAANVTTPMSMFTDWGYVGLRFDRRGCGASGGVPGLNLCPEHVADARAAVTWLAARPEVMADRIALAGTSFGGALAVYAAAVDPRVAAVISAGGWGNGERKLRGQHPTAEGWDKFVQMLARGKEHRQKTGTSLMVHRFDIVPIPPHLRTGLPATAIMEFPHETAQSIYDFRPDDVVGDIAPRPALFLHAAPDSVTPTSESLELFRRAKPPAELHLFHGVDHFMLAEGNARVTATLRGWLETYFPAA
jgi:pimeloyl-ACP methyl ester carboxylesterase